MSAPRPLNLVAELTYRCPLQCPYCSNPTDLRAFPDAMETADWVRVMHQAAALGIVHVGLTGGEPSARRDLAEIVGASADAGLYSHLVTAALPLDGDGLARLVERGLCSVQISLQDSEAGSSDRIAGTTSFERKLALARAARELELPLTLNVVLHRHNLDRVGAIIEISRELDADRLELANAQYQGWALLNRAALLPTREQVDAAAAVVAEARKASKHPEILFVLPDYFRDRPKACMGGWASQHIVVTPDGRALPCHGAAELPDLEFYNVREHALEQCWTEAPGMNAYRGDAWMQEPCRSCPAKNDDFGGCRCQAFALLGDASATDPACGLSPNHGRIEAAHQEARVDEFRYRSRSDA